MKRRIFLLVSVFLCAISIQAIAQLRKRPYPSYLRETNSIFTMPDGWRIVNSQIGEYGYVFCFTYSPLSIYSKDLDMYIFFGDQPIIADYRHTTDAAANNFYLDSEYLAMEKLTFINENITTSSMLCSAHVDTVVEFEVQMDHPYLGKYRYAKQFVLHRQDVANIPMTFVARNEDDKATIDRIFKKTWGMIRFKPDSAFHPTEHRNQLVGKFRHLRPNLHTKDEITNTKSRRRMHYLAAMINGKLARKSNHIHAAKTEYLNAHQLQPQKYVPFEKLFMLYINNGQTDSAEVYWHRLYDEYLPDNPNLLVSLKYGLSMLYDKKGMYDSAIVVNKQLLKLRPQNAGHIYFALGDNYRKTGSYKSALKAYKKAQQLYIEKSPHHREASTYNYRIGECYEQLSNRQLAKKYFKKAQEEGYTLPDEVKEKYEL